MKPEQVQAVRELLSAQRILSLAVVVDDEPHVGLLPYVLTEDYSAAVVHASALARHTQGLQPGALCSVLFHRPDAPDADPLQTKRATFKAAVEILDKGSSEYHTAQQHYLQRFSASEPTFSLGDFNLFCLRFKKGRYVAGFAQALNVSIADLTQLDDP